MCDLSLIEDYSFFIPEYFLPRSFFLSDVRGDKESRKRIHATTLAKPVSKERNQGSLSRVPIVLIFWHFVTIIDRARDRRAPLHSAAYSKSESRRRKPRRRIQIILNDFAALFTAFV